MQPQYSLDHVLTNAEFISELQDIRKPLHVGRSFSTGAPCLGVSSSGNVHLATLPSIFPEWLGDSGFLSTHRVRFPYVVGEMAHGISTAAMVIEASRCGMLGFLGCAGMQPQAMEMSLDTIKAAVAEGASWGANLIHSPHDPQREMRTVEIFLRQHVERVSASAFMDLTPAIVRFALSGLHLSPAGDIMRKHHVFAKVSRAETATRFMLPAPAAIVDVLLRQGDLTEQEAQLAQYVPLAEDITVEADSGGHTDNRPLMVLLPTIMRLRDDIVQKQGIRRAIRIGAAGGLGEPSAVAAAFSMGAAYVLTGSINQAAVEAGTSLEVKRLLAQADIADTMMAPSADLFELGIKVQVLKRETLFAMRARLLHDLYRESKSLEDIPAHLRSRLEKDIFRMTLQEVWQQTRIFWITHGPEQVERAEQDAKHRMALCFRAYLGQASGWARAGDPTRKSDYQIWCGPAMGSFNRWVKGSFLEPVEGRTISQIGLNLLEGAAVVARTQQVRMMGIELPARAYEFRPRVLN